MSTNHWVAVWGSAPSVTATVPATYAKNVTLRYNLRAQLSGTQLRLHFNNLYGQEDAVLTRVYLIKAGRDAVPVTFAGNFACPLAAGAQTVSDAIDFPLERGEEYAISIYLQEITPLHSGTKDNGPLCNFQYAEGDFAADAVLPPFHTAAMDNAYFLDTVDILTDDPAVRAVVCFGDSITAQSWPDYLALRLLRDENSRLAVVRRGIGGSRVLRRYEYLQHRHYGPAGQERFVREISAASVDRVIILHGINDLIHPGTNEFRPWSELPTPQELIDGLRWYIEQAHALGVKAYLGTILTIKGWTSYRPERETVRHAVNEWIRTQQEADGVVDFDAFTRSASDPDQREPAFDVGDHIHPSLAGAEHMAESVPQEYLK